VGKKKLPISLFHLRISSRETRVSSENLPVFLSRSYIFFEEIHEPGRNPCVSSEEIGAFEEKLGGANECLNKRAERLEGVRPVLVERIQRI